MAGSILSQVKEPLPPVPLLPSVEWWSRLVKSLAFDPSLAKAVASANETLVSSRDFGRCVIQNVKGENLILSMAIEGGGRQLRYKDMISRLLLSEHGDWRRNHLKAFEACLGSLPFYHDLDGPMAKIYMDKEVVNLNKFNTAIFSYILSFLLENVSQEELKSFYCNETVKTRGKELATGLNPGISILQALASHGKETLLGLLSED